MKCLQLPQLAKQFNFWFYNKQFNYQFRSWLAEFFMNEMKGFRTPDKPKIKNNEFSDWM
jgi:hypothetical protein